MLKNIKDMSKEELVAYIQSTHSNKKERVLTFKVTPKGGVGVYGLQKFPVTLYKKQWTKLIAAMGDLEAFINANVDSLTEKNTDLIEVQDDAA